MGEYESLSHSTPLKPFWAAHKRKPQALLGISHSDTRISTI